MTRLEMVADHMRRQEWTRLYGTTHLPPEWSSAPDAAVWTQRARDAVAGLNAVGVANDIAARALREAAGGVEGYLGFDVASYRIVSNYLDYRAEQIERSNA